MSISMGGLFGLAALVLVLPLAGGCGQSDSVGKLNLNPVKGTVLQADGKPLSTGRVAFVLPEKGFEFSGDIQSDGSYTLGTPETPGAVEGTYKVRIDPESSKSSPAKGRQPKKANLPFAEKYADETTSGLTATVKPGDNTIEPFKLVPGTSKDAPDKADRHLDQRD
jgi:hypothetical protein